MKTTFTRKLRRLLETVAAFDVESEVEMAIKLDKSPAEFIIYERLTGEKRQTTLTAQDVLDARDLLHKIERL